MFDKIKTFIKDITNDFSGVHFVYEDTDSFSNLISCPDVNSSGIKRFTPSPLALEALRLETSEIPGRVEFGKNFKYSAEPPKFKKYVIPTGVAHSPPDWCGNNGIDKFPELTNERNRTRVPPFFYLNQQYLDDVRNKQAFILFDQSHEGYQTNWLWDWFHNCCTLYDISPSQIIYVTGNLEAEHQYRSWATNKNITNTMLVLSYPHFEGVMHFNSTHHDKGLFGKTRKLPSVADHIAYKELKLSEIKTFNALQKRARVHRIWFFKYLWEAGLIKNNIISMNSFESYKSYYEGKTLMPEEYSALANLLPLMPPENPEGYNLSNFADGDCGNYLTAFNEHTMLDTWLTVVSEASFSDEELTCFISEKTFKPIACCHPFIIAGNRYSLKNLKELGYKTFHPYIDETYDTLPTWERFPAIIKSIKMIDLKTPKEKLEWYKQLEDILQYNREVFYKNCEENIPPAYLKMCNYIREH